MAPNRKHNITKFLGPRVKSDETKIPVPEQAFDFMKNRNPQQLVDFLLPNDDDVKTSSENASGSKFNILHANSGLFTCEEEKIFHA